MDRYREFFIPHQLAHFSKRYRVLAYDPRSQGRSSKTLENNSYAQQVNAEAGQARLASNAPHSETFVLGNHMMFREHPEAFNARLDRFLAKVGR
jgi:pimeloyl-ACP methyl ester carboxylesterase